MKKRLISLTFISCFFCSIFAQDVVNSKIETLGIFSTGDNTPFWLTNNKYGIGSTDKNKQYLRTSSIAEKQISPEWAIAGGLDIIGANGFESHFFLQQAFLDLKFKKMSLSIGLKEREIPFKNMNLFSGSMTLSNNARPIPQVEISTLQFITIPSTNNWLHFKTGGSFGYFTDDNYKKENAGNGNYAQKVWYHRKYLFVKIENERPWSAIVGLEMDTQFGGDFYLKGLHTSSSPVKLKSFFNVLIPTAGDSDSNITDQVNIVGNVYGSYHMIFRYKFDNFSLNAYHEHFFEDHSGMAFKNIPDGSYGIEVNSKKKQLISSIVLEYIHTKNQSGPILWDKTNEIPVQVSAADNYYNHGDYISLSNHGMTLGNPLLTSPIYNKGSSLIIKNSRLTAFHAGIGGNISDKLDYRMKFTYSRSWGTPFFPSINIKNQISSVIECIYTPQRFEGWKLSGALAHDKSSMVGDNLGVELKLSKSFKTGF